MLKTVTPNEAIYFPQDTHPEPLFVLSQIGDMKDKVVIDIGCGPNKTHPQMIGVDIKPGITDMEGRAEGLPFIDHYADAIVMRHCLEHVLDQVAAVKEWLRVLKFGGKVIIILPDHGSIDTMDYYISGGVHVHAYCMDSFRSFLSLFPELTIQSMVQVIPDWSFGTVITV